MRADLYHSVSRIFMKKIYLDVKSGVLFDENTKYGTLNISERNILAALMASDGVTCTKEHLLEVGWPGRIVVPAALNISIKNIRGALKNADMERSLVTVPREGYLLEPGFILSYEDKYRLRSHTAREGEHEPVLSIEPDSAGAAIANNSQLIIWQNKFFCKTFYFCFILLSVLSFGISAFMFLVTPSFECFKIENVGFCGGERLSVEEVTVPLSDEHLYWFTREVDDEATFHKIR